MSHPLTLTGVVLLCAVGAIILPSNAVELCGVAILFFICWMMAKVALGK